MNHLNIFITYVFHEKDNPHRKAIVNYLNLFKPFFQNKRTLLNIFHEDLIAPGINKSYTLETNLKKANLVILFLSLDFFVETRKEPSSGKLFTKMVEMHNLQQLEIIPIILRPCMLEITIFKDIVTLPKRNSITESRNKDSTYLEIAREIKIIIENMIDDSKGNIISMNRGGKPSPPSNSGNSFVKFVHSFIINSKLRLTSEIRS